MTTKIILLLTTITSGLTAGLFWAYAYSVMPALRTVDDRVYVTAMNRINSVIPASGWFWVCFGGGLLLAVASVILIAIGGNRAALPWVIIAAGFFVLAVIVTSVINVPLNTALAAVDATTDPATLAATRQSQELPWVRANVIRTVLHTVAFVASCIALLVYRES